MDNTEKHDPGPGFLKQNVDGYEEHYPSDAWDKLEKKLEKKRKRRFIFWWFFGLGLISVMGLWFWNQTFNQPTSQLAKKTTVETIQPSAPQQEQKSLPKEATAPTENIAQNDNVKANHADQKMVKEEPVSSLGKKTGNNTGQMNQTVAGDQVSVDNTNENYGKPAKQKTVSNESVSGSVKKYAKETEQMTRNITADQISTNNTNEDYGKPADKKSAEKQVVKSKLPKAYLTTAPTDRKKVDKPALSKRQGNQIETPSQAKNQVNPAGKTLVPPIEKTQNQASENVVVETVPEAKPKAPEPVITPEEPIVSEVQSKPTNAEKVTASDSVLQKKTALVQKTDSATVAIQPDTTKKEKPKENFWFVAANLGSLIQGSTIIPANPNGAYYPTNQEAYYQIKPSDIQPGLIASLQVNRLWSLHSAFQVGVKIRASFIYQSLKANLDPGRYSASNFQMVDPYTFNATSIVATGPQTYSRQTWLSDYGLEAQWKPSWSPLGVGIHWVAARMQILQYSSNVGENNNGSLSWFVRPPDWYIFYPIGEKYRILLEGFAIKYGDRNLPMPIKNTGNQYGITLGVGLKW